MDTRSPGVVTIATCRHHPTTEATDGGVRVSLVDHPDRLLGRAFPPPEDSLLRRRL